jgi:putative ABC transport system permease protein
MLRIIDDFLFSYREAVHAGLRTFLTLVGIIIGIAAIVSLISVGAGLNSAVEKQFEVLGSNAVYLYPGNPFGQGTSSITITENDLSNVQNISGVTNLLKMYLSQSAIEAFGEKTVTTVMGYNTNDGQFFIDNGYFSIVDGGLIDEKNLNTVLVDVDFQKNGFSKEISVGKIIKIDGKEFTVAGIVRSNYQQQELGANGFIIMPESSFTKNYPTIGPAETWVRTTSSNENQYVKDEMLKYFDSKYGEDSVYVITSEGLMEQVNSILSLLTIFLVGIGSISIIVGAVGISNSMITSVLERTKEIGLMKALGASDLRIMGIFLIESSLISAVGGVFGALLGFGISTIISIIGKAAGFPLESGVSLELFIGAILFAMIIGAISGFVPARRAAKLDPIDALRYE